MGDRADGRRTQRRVARARGFAAPRWWLVALGCLVALVAPAAAAAHANLIRTVPADAAVVTSAPREVRLFFDDRVRTQPGMRAVNANGDSVLGGTPRIVGGRELVIPLRSGLGRGSYTVLWRILADDGHPLAGITTFGVGAGEHLPRPALTAPSQRQALPDFERWLFLSGVLLGFGLAAFRFAMPREVAPPLRLLAAALAVAAVGAALLAERGSLSTRFGVVMAVAAAVAVGGAVAGFAATYLPPLATLAWLCAAALVVAPSASGHALDPGRPRIEFPVDVLHVAAASVWFGGVVAVVAAARHAPFRELVVRRFSSLAAASVTVIGVTGIVRAFSELSSVGQVWSTSYGRLLIVKTVLFVALLAFGWMNRYRFIPALARYADRLRWNLRGEIVLLLALIGAVAVLTQSRPGRDAVAAPASAPRAAVAEEPEDAVVLAQTQSGVQLAGPAANGVSIDGTTLLWETLPEIGVAALVERNLATRRTETLARNVASLYGLAVTETSIVYAKATNAVRLVAVDRRSGRVSTLGESLAAPFARRGDRVAWAEESSGRQRVVVYDLRRHSAWTAASLPSCTGTRCYRIDGVTLADRGVVFVRSAIGTQPSLVVRRSFGSPTLEVVKVAHDPQPDLVSSATGAAYYALGRGWYRWDFGTARPEPIRAFAAGSDEPLGFDGHTWLVREQRGCDDVLAARTESGRTTVVAAPASAQEIAGVRSRVCVRFENISWRGSRPITTWIVVPRAAHAGEPTGVIVLGPRLASAPTGAIP